MDQTLTETEVTPDHRARWSHSHSATSSGRRYPWMDTAVAQGTHPADHANCWGHILFAVPRLQHTPARAAVSLYAQHWYYNAGGAAVLSVVDRHGVRLTRPMIVNDWPKPGAKMVELPEDWLPLFRGDGAGAGIGFGLADGLGTDLRFYGLFEVRSAQLLLWEPRP